MYVDNLIPVCVSGYQLMRSGSLLIEEAQVSDAGTYVCYVSNDAGSDIGQVRLKVLGRQ